MTNEKPFTSFENRPLITEALVDIATTLRAILDRISPDAPLPTVSKTVIPATITPRNEGPTSVTRADVADMSWLYILQSKFQSKCRACQAPYNQGDTIFVKVPEKHGYHVKCAPAEAKETSFYKRAVSQ